MGIEPFLTVVDLVEEEVDNHPTALAVVGEDRTFSYRQLDETANRIAHALERADPDRRHAYGAVLVAPGAWPIAALLGVAKSGRAMVGLDVTAPPPRLVEIRDQLGSFIAVVDRAHRDRLDAGTPVVVLEELAADLPAVRPTVTLGPDSGFSVHFTSGSTGRPKGALRTHRAQARGGRDHLWTSGFRPGLRVSLLHDVAFAASRTTIWGGLVNGVEIHVRDMRTYGPTGLAAWLAERRIQVLAAPASLIEAMLAFDPPLKGLPDLDQVSFTGDVLRMQTLRNVVPFLRPDTKVRNTYGSSEMGLVSSFMALAGELPEGDLVPVGTVADDVSVRIIDPDERGVGEIEVSGPKVAVRYVDDATDDRGSYRDDGRRWFRSGDLGLLHPDGRLEVRGRLDDRVKVRGQSIDPAEVEQTLLARPDVADVHVGLRGAAATDCLVAWIQPVPGAAPTVTDVRRGLRSQLPGWMIPQRVVLVEPMPRTDRGKVDRVALPAPGAQRPELDVAFAVPRTPLELRLAEAFGAVLGVERVGRDDPFFDLGGDSLAAAELIDHVSRALGRDLPTEVFLEAATPAALATRLEAEPQGPDDRLLPLQTAGDGLPVVLVHAGHGFVISYGHLAEAMAGHRPVFGLQMLPTDRARDLRSLSRLTRRYADLLDRRLPGPVVVAGYSGGSLLAHALTTELAGRGRDVPATVLLDPVLVTHPPRRAKAIAYDLLARTPVRLRPERLIQQRMAVTASAARRHRPTPTAVPIVVVRAQAAEPEAWAPLTTAGVRVIDVGGAHRSMLYPPHSAALGERLEPILRELDERAGRPSGGP